jgi:hypothetical protein
LCDWFSLAVILLRINSDLIDALLLLFAFVVLFPLATWWAVAAISAVLDPKGFFERAYGRFHGCFRDIPRSKTPLMGYVPIDYTVWMATWLHGVKERVQLYVPRRDAPKLLRRLWWCTISHTLLFRGCAFYWIGATFWLVVELFKLLRR